VVAAQSAAREEERRTARDAEKAAEVLRRAASQASTEVQARLQTVVTERQKVQEQSESHKREIRGRHDKAVAESQKASTAKVNELRLHLKARSQVKPESAKSDFPAYRIANARGFKPGTEPSSHEMAMTASERQQAQLMLMNPGHR
jgi:uncharacterized protein (DUF3084 family)